MSRMLNVQRDVAKRAMDVSLAAVGLVASVPLQLVVAAVVYRDLGSPVLFKQSRPGLHGRPFVLVKFRTMHEVGTQDGEESDEARLTRVGALLRSMSLDELPTLWNVLRGDMSLVGPRPLLHEYLGRYSSRQMRRHEVRPGVTGLAQVRGRNELDWEDKLELDVRYVETWSIWGDVRILLRTIGKVLRREGITAVGSVTADPFVGTGNRT